MKTWIINITKALLIGLLMGVSSITGVSAQQVDICYNEDDEQRYTCVTPAPVTFVDPVCNQIGTYTIPQSTGVDYVINNTVVAAGTYEAANGSSVTITATPQQGYLFNQGVPTVWTYTFNIPVNCEQPPVVTQITRPPTAPVHAGVGIQSYNPLYVLGAVGSLGLIGLGLHRKSVTK
jgi:hypothetical protein